MVNKKNLPRQNSDGRPSHATHGDGLLILFRQTIVVRLGESGRLLSLPSVFGNRIGDLDLAELSGLMPKNAKSGSILDEKLKRAHVSRSKLSKMKIQKLVTVVWQR